MREARGHRTTRARRARCVPLETARKSGADGFALARDAEGTD